MLKIYEVLKLYNGIPLFFNEHMDRFHKSLKDLFPGNIGDLKNQIMGIINSHGIVPKNYNIKIIYEPDTKAFRIENTMGNIPSLDDYLYGVKISLMDGTRNNPLVKYENTELRSLANNMITETGIYEVLLVNPQGIITEGSRSNFMLIDSNNNIICSKESKILKGVTQQKVLQNVENISIIHKDIRMDDLIEANSLIITSTTPGVLPVKSCNDINYITESKPIRILMDSYIRAVNMDYNKNKDLFNYD